MRRLDTRHRRHRGAALVYSLVLLTLLLAMVSLGMDYAHCQSVKTEEQRCADLSARGLLQMYQTWGDGYANTLAYQSQVVAANAVDGKYSGACPPFTAKWGTWDATAHTWTDNASSRTGMKVTVYRTAAGGNPVKLIFPLLTGNGQYPVKTTVDVSATAIAYVAGGQNGAVNIPRNADPYLAGMPSGSQDNTGYGDSTSNATPYQMTCVNVVPGTTITFTNMSGTSSIYPGHVDSTGADGDTTTILHHGENYNGTPNPPWPNTENGIADAKMPADAFSGVFLTDSSPDQNTAPASVDWTDAAHANQASYSNLKTQQPFLIGDGQTTGGVTQTFTVPPGATRLFLSVWDGVDYQNNSGGLSGTINVQQKIVLAQ